MASLAERITNLAARVAAECKAIRTIAEGRSRKYCVAVGDGVNTTYEVVHNLGTEDVSVYVYASGAPKAGVIADVYHTTPNKITVEFREAPTLGAYRVVVTG